MGRAGFPPFCLAMVEVMEIMVTSFKRSHTYTAALSALDPATGNCQPLPLPETLSWPKWQRNRMGRLLYLPKIYQKIIWMLSNFHKTTSEHWWRTPGTQKGSPFSLKGGRTKYKRQNERQELGMETSPREGVVKEEKFPHNRKSSHRRVCGKFWNLRRQHNWKEKKKKKRIQA